MPTKSYMAKKDQVPQRWLLVDADGAVLGRMAAKIAVMLMGKDKPTWTPHVDVGDYIVVINAEKVKVTGAKAEQKFYDSYSRYPSGYKIVPFARMLAKKPEFIIQTAVRKMLPKTQMGKRALKKLKVFRGPKHEHQAQEPEKVELF